MPTYAYKAIRPVIDGTAFVHPDATIIGDVQIGANVFIGAQAVLRGDFGKIIIEDGANVQETCVVHCFPDKVVTISENAHVGHGAIIHGAFLGVNAMVGMNAVIMDRAYIGKNCIIGANALVTENKEIPDNSMVLGSPAKVVKTLSDEQGNGIRIGAKHYVENARRFREQLTAQEEAAS